MDVDGTLTNGLIIIDSMGNESKQFNVKDGMGVKLAREAGYKTGIITGRSSDVVRKRANEMQIDVVIQGSTNKIEDLNTILHQFNLTQEEVAYIGDDINDIGICQTVGLSFAVNDASNLLKKNVDIVLNKNGGNGAVREAIELIVGDREDPN